MTQVVFNPATKKSIDSFLAKPTHAVMLVGPQGVGKGHVAKYLASTLLGILPENTLSHPYVLLVGPSSTSIGIDSIREIKTFLSLRVPGSNSIRRVLIIENAQLMSIEAQNALLKLLEEPPVDTVIILTSTSEQMVLSTIESRVQVLQVLRLRSSQMANFSDDDKLVALADGRPGLLFALAHDEDHVLARQIEKAKIFLKSDKFDRLVQTSSIKERAEADVFLQALLIICGTAMRNSAKLGGHASSWQKRTKCIYVAEDHLMKNVSIKLLLTDLALSL